MLPNLTKLNFLAIFSYKSSIYNFKETSPFGFALMHADLRADWKV